MGNAMNVNKTVYLWIDVIFVGAFHHNGGIHQQDY